MVWIEERSRVRRLEDSVECSHGMKGKDLRCQQRFTNPQKSTPLTKSRDVYKIAFTTVAAKMRSRLPEHTNRSIPGNGDDFAFTDSPSFPKKIHTENQHKSMRQSLPPSLFPISQPIPFRNQPQDEENSQYPSYKRPKHRPHCYLHTNPSHSTPNLRHTAR